MLNITATVYKNTGKYYDSCVIKKSEEVKIYDMCGIANLLKEKIPFIEDGLIVIQDNEDSDGFHNHLFRVEELVKELEYKKRGIQIE